MSLQTVGGNPKEKSVGLCAVIAWESVQSRVCVEAKCNWCAEWSVSVLDGNGREKQKRAGIECMEVEGMSGSCSGYVDPWFAG